MPTDAHPWVEDRRRLGVYVARIVLRHGDEVSDIPLEGDALLSLLPADTPTILEIHAGVADLAYPA